MTSRHALPLFALSLALVLGCTKKKSGDVSDDDASSSKKKRKKKKKKKKEGPHEPEVFVRCQDAKGLDYLTSSKTSEAKNTLGAISRGAAAAYEREVVVDEVSDTAATHALCKSAQPVPSDGPPKGKKYRPKGDGKDFDTGDAATGWRCLKFLLAEPHYYQYGYNVGSGYKSTEFGLPDPGPDGYEAWAMGDLDGDGIPSLFVRTGKVDKASERLKINPDLSCVDPGE